MFETAPNPALGLRAIRWSLSGAGDVPDASCARCCGRLRSGPSRFLCRCWRTLARSTRRWNCSARAKASLDADGLAYDPGIKVGAMIEIPAAVLILPVFLRRMDFLSDRHERPDPVHARHRPRRQRGGASVRPAASGGAATDRAHHPRGPPGAACRFRCAARWPAIAAMTRLLLGMGLREFSMHPSQLLRVKQKSCMPTASGWSEAGRAGAERLRAGGTGLRAEAALIAAGQPWRD
ncbi:putative PEP-binding protein [Cupriavidus basilensis]